MSRRRVLNNKDVLNIDDQYVAKRKKLALALRGRKPITPNGPAVDPECPIDNGRVYIKGTVLYDVTLNQTNIAQNNNKFYKISIVEDSAGKFHLWFRWGRVGYRGQTSLRTMSIEKAVDLFEEKFFAKTLNNFSELKKFKHHVGKYDLVKVDYSKQQPTGSNLIVDENIPSKLNEEVKRLVDNICDWKMMEKHLRRMNYDTNSGPLGSITRDQIKSGLKSLSDIEKLILKSNFGADFRCKVNEYYTRIPHHFGMSTPSLLNTLEDLKDEISLLETLASVDSLKNEPVTAMALHPSDRNYMRMKCDISVLEPSDKQFKTGYMFGKGIYFADCITKSANYCCAEIGSSGLIGLSEVALGKQQLRTGEDYNASKLADGCLSTKGIGKHNPAVRSNKKMFVSAVMMDLFSILDDQTVIVPSGIQRELKNCKSDLLFNEYIVYNPSQVRLRFLVEVEFLPKPSN